MLAKLMFICGDGKKWRIGEAGSKNQGASSKNWRMEALKKMGIEYFDYLRMQWTDIKQKN